MIGDRLVELAGVRRAARHLRPAGPPGRRLVRVPAGRLDAVDAVVAAARATAHPGRTPVAWMHLLWTEACAVDAARRARAGAGPGRGAGTAAWRVRRFTAEFTRAAHARRRSWPSRGGSTRRSGRSSR